MDETREQLKFYGVFWIIAFLLVIYDISYFGSLIINESSVGFKLLYSLSKIPFLNTVILTKLSSLVMLSLIGIGTTTNKFIDVKRGREIVFPILLGLGLMFASVWYIYNRIGYIEPSNDAFLNTIRNLNSYQIIYIAFTFFGAIFYIKGISNITKIVKSNFNDDTWNYEGESFLQETRKLETDTSINIPTKFLYKKKYHNGWINMNPFRGILVIGTPGSGKTFSIINPVIRQMIDKGFSLCIYDYKYPDLAQIAYYKYLQNYTKRNNSNMNFKVLNLDDIQKSVRVNPLSPKYIKTLADALETASCIVESIQKTENESGSAVFFKESAVNLLACAIYFLAKFEGGKYSDLPHVVSLITSDYDTLFDCLFGNEELHELLSPFYSTYINKAYEQLEGQVGTLRILLSKNATKEAYYIFSKDDYQLDISNPDNPSILILASSPNTQSVNSVFYSLVISRISKLVNRKGNVPFGFIVDELPTIYFYKIEELLATARSNRVSVVLGLQEIPQFKLAYGKVKSENITSIFGNILSGSVRSTETLNWLERLFGKKKQVNESINLNKKTASITYSERLESVIPQGKIATLDTGEMVGMIVKDIEKNREIQKSVPSIVNCKINLEMNEIFKEEKNYQPIPPSFVFENATDDEIDEYLIQYMVTIRKEIKYIHHAVVDMRQKEKERREEEQEKEKQEMEERG